MLSHAPACGKIPRRARALIRLAGKQWDKFLAIWDTLASPESDQLIEDFSPFYARFRELQRLGVPFDQSFAAKVEAINLANRFRDDDSDADAADELIDREDSDEDNDNSDREPS